MKKILLILSAGFLFHFVNAKEHFYIKVQNGVYQGYSAGVDYYSIPTGDSLKLTAIFESINPMMVSTGLSVDWYVDNVYQFTQGGVVSFSQPSVLIYFRALYTYSVSVTSDNKIMFTYVTGLNDLTAELLPYPFSQAAVNTSNLSYTIVNIAGQVIEKGNFTGEIILRNKNSQQEFSPGIYFVIYYDALDNRQVLEDKVFVSDR